MSKSPLGKSPAFRIGAMALAWLVVITAAHLWLNRENRASNHVLMGYMPVVANLAAPLVDFVSKGEDPRFEAVKFSSFSEMGEAFRSGHIQAAFIIAPLALMLFEQGVPLKVVYIGARHESTLVMRASAGCESPLDLVGKKIAVPVRYSGHNLALKRFLRRNGLSQGDVRILEIPPPEMPAALAASEIDGYFVGEPFAGKSLQNGAGKRFLDVESVWPNFICNLLIVREELIQSHPEWVDRLVAMAARSGLWARENMEEAIKIISRYWGQDPDFIRYVFSNPPGRFRFDLFAPLAEELEDMAREMRLEGLLKGNRDIRAMVETRFALAVKRDAAMATQGVYSIRPGPPPGFRAQAAKR